MTQQGPERVQVTEREFKMEMSMQDLLRRNSEMTRELAMNAGSLSFAEAKQARLNGAMKELEWRIQQLELFIMENKLKVPVRTPMPEGNQRTETIDLPPPAPPAEEPLKVTPKSNKRAANKK